MSTFGRILIADSSERSLITTTDFPQNLGYLCTPVHDGYEAFRALEQNQYDLLITEIHIPGNEQLELVHFVSSYTNGMPVILYTADPSLIRRSLRSSFR